MTIARAPTARFAPERLFTPASLAILGAGTPAGQRICANMSASTFAGPVWHDLLPAAPDLAVIAAPPAEVPKALADLAAAGGRAAVVTSQVDDLASIASMAGVRVLGASSFGLAVPGIGLNATLSHMEIPHGRVALVTQSTSLARAVVDWAGPNGVGFSHVVGLGGNVDFGFAPTLDWLSRDPGTGLILLDIRRIRNSRAFISAARAASRLRPVVAVRPGARLLDPSGRAAAVFGQALRRAGVFVVDGMEALFAAAETLSRTPKLRHETMAVVTNAIGPGRLACDAALRAGITLADLPEHVHASLSGSLPAELVHGLVYVGRLPVHVAEAAAMLSAVPGLGGILLLLTPTGAADAVAIEAVAAAAQTARMPVLSCLMGETTGAPGRARLASAGLPAFATPEQAVAAFAHLLRDKEARAAARELPAARVLEVAPDRATQAALFADVRRAGRLVLDDTECHAVLAAYGIGAETLAEVRLSVDDDPMFGPAIGCVVPGHTPAFDLPPLNLTLAQDVAKRSGVSEPAALDATAALLVRISQLLIDAPDIASLSLDTATGSASITLRTAGAASSFAIAPYPDALITHWQAAGQSFILRPIRPEDAQAHAAMIARVPREDLRYRFFTAVREIGPEQMARLTQVDYEREMALIAVREPDGATVGVCRLVRETGGQDAGAEFAVLVEPSVKGLGLATELMRRLIGWGQSQGLARITGQVLADNHPMLGFVRHLGFEVHALPGETDVLETVLDLRPSK